MATSASIISWATSLCTLRCRLSCPGNLDSVTGPNVIEAWIQKLFELSCRSLPVLHAEEGSRPGSPNNIVSASTMFSGCKFQIPSTERRWSIALQLTAIQVQSSSTSPVSRENLKMILRASAISSLASFNILGDDTSGPGDLSTSKNFRPSRTSSLIMLILTIGILSRGKCGLSKCVTRYLVAMSVADLLVIILDLILRHIPIVYKEQFQFLRSIPVCNIHAVLLYTATDCSVWFTVTFTFDRFVAICCQKLKSKYCSEKTSAVVLGTVTVLSCLKNIFWYFMFTGRYWLSNNPWFCVVTKDVQKSHVWGTIEFLHNILTPGIPFVLILLLNALIVRHILVSSRGRRRLRAHSSGESRRDPEMESRRKSIILLLVISGNFILLWAVSMVFSIWWRMVYLVSVSVSLPLFLQKTGFMLQLLSCCTNTVIYAVTQTQFREQVKNVLKYPFTTIVTLIQ
ncbi:probable G-protein coupled receptor 139 [Heterodontus francisci]|uniref:probable G-protein coupled receptor 139 n=1 Tax=Heterodontus francisci TaxID=7792 RepID=UPI00355C438B